MKTLSLAITLLKREIKQNITYCAIWTLSISICFVFIDIGTNKNLIATDIVQSYGTMAPVVIPLSLALPFLVICICGTIVLYVNTYYLNKKVKEFALLAISGGTQIDAAKYVLTQILMILCIAIPLALIIGTLVLSLLYPFMYHYLGITAAPIITSNTYYMALLAIFFLVFTVIISVAGFAHRNTIQTLFGRSEEMEGTKIKKATSNGYIYLIIYGIGILLMFVQEHALSAYIVPTVVGIVSMYGLIKKTIPNEIKKWKKKKGIEKRYAFIALSNYSISLQGTIFLIMFTLLLVSSLIPILISQEPSTNEYMTGVISYIVIIVLIIVGLLCKFTDTIMVRKTEFINISNIGYNHKEISKIIFYEVLTFYATVLLLPLPYILLIGLRFIIYDNLAISTFLYLLLIYLIPLLLSIPITQYIYKKIVMTPTEGEIQRE